MEVAKKDYAWRLGSVDVGAGLGAWESTGRANTNDLQVQHITCRFCLVRAQGIFVAVKGLQAQILLVKTHVM